MTPDQLLDEARAARLSVIAGQGKLIVRGPKGAEPELLQRLLGRKVELMQVLMAVSVDERE